MSRMMHEIAVPKRNAAHTSRLALLPAEQRETLNSWLKQNVSYKEIQNRLREKFGVSVSISALSIHYQRHHAKVARSAAEIQAAEIQRINVGHDVVEVDVLIRLHVRQTKS